MQTNPLNLLLPLFPLLLYDKPMPHSLLYNSIILKSYDVGEADRFLVLLTKERGRLSARARAVRKLTSKLGGSLLPFNHVTIGLHEGKAGFLVTSAQMMSYRARRGVTETKSFLNAQQGVELLLTLLHDEEPLPEIFELTLEFLNDCTPNPILPFTVNILRSLGLLPTNADLPKSESELNSLCNEIISDHSNTSPKVSKIASLIN